jgi:hypothetical protein
MAVAAVMAEPSPLEMGVLGPAFSHDLLGVQYSGAAASMGNESCWLVPSVTCAAVGAVGTVIQKRWFPWCLRVKVSGHVAVESVEL